MNNLSLNRDNVARRLLNIIISESGEEISSREFELKKCTYDIQSAIIHLANEIANFDNITEAELNFFAINHIDYLNSVMKNGYVPAISYYDWWQHTQTALIHFIIDELTEDIEELLWKIGGLLYLTDYYYENAQRKAVHNYYIKEYFHRLPDLMRVLTDSKENAITARRGK